VDGAWHARPAGVTRTIGPETARHPGRMLPCTTVRVDAVRVGTLTQIRAISLIYQTLYTDSSLQKYQSCRVILLTPDPGSAIGVRLHVVRT
jgi:hypothetical protein